MKIKICGLQRKEDILYANMCMPDYVGFVFAKSRRRVTKEQAQWLRRELLDGIIPVGVFVNAPMDEIAELVRERIIDIAQLHGDETEEYIVKLRSLVPEAKIIKAVRVACAEAVRGCEETTADYLLFDAYTGNKRGGTGKTFDWELARGVKKPYFLAGGVSVENISNTSRMSGLYAVDVSSAVETDGYKDKEKMQRLVQAVRQMSTQNG
ncbi:MAG: phosphoribosylanthranilate isomerase [Lachnospiraceae bacterium]|nr:phosphoribosylanthranilate isomerase [Lachnospiraceae bacterium]